MVKEKLDKKIRQDPVLVIIIALIFSVLMFGALIVMHIDERQAIKNLRSDLNHEIELREVR